jgi:hypothetical protein
MILASGIEGKRASTACSAYQVRGLLPKESSPPEHNTDRDSFRHHQMSLSPRRSTQRTFFVCWYPHLARFIDEPSDTKGEHLCESCSTAVAEVLFIRR